MSNHFKQFVAHCNRRARILQQIEPRDQAQLMNDLFKLEDSFRELISDKKWTNTIYNEFVNYIVKVKKNILVARVYFRERQTTFSGEMSKLFKANDSFHLLAKYRINFKFVKWVCENFSATKYKQLHDLKLEMIKIRQTLAEKDVFLALNRARLFWSKTVNWKLDYMDIIQDACEGHMEAIDKFCPPYTDTFKNVIVGRMLLKMLTDNSATMVKLPPADQRILYRVNNAKFREGLVVPEDILKFVQESFPGVTLKKMLSIEASTEIHYPFSGTSDSGASRWTDDSEFGNPEDLVADADLKNKMNYVYNELSVFQKKVYKLKYGDKR